MDPNFQRAKMLVFRAEMLRLFQFTFKGNIQGYIDK